MSLSAEQLQALDALPPPASLDRILRFLSDLGTQGNESLGQSGRSAQAFAASLAGGLPSFSARQVGGWAAILMDRYQIKLGEIQEFSLWFVQRQEIFAERADTVVEDPGPALARPPAPDMALVNPPAPAAPVAFGMALAAPAVGRATPAAGKATPVAEVSAAPRQTLRRQPVAEPGAAPPDPVTLDAAQVETAPPAPPADRLQRRQGPRKALREDAPRARRIERGPAPLEATDAPDTEAVPEESAPPPRRSFRLAPQMITRPAFVTNVGLAGMLAGLSLGGTPAAAMAAPEMALAVPPPPGFGTVPGMLPAYGPTGTFGMPISPVFGQPGLGTMGAPAPTVTPAFSPLVTPMTPTGAASLPPPVWLGMPPAPPAAPSPMLPTPRTAIPPEPGAIAPTAAGLTSRAPQMLDTLPGVPAEHSCRHTRIRERLVCAAPPLRLSPLCAAVHPARREPVPPSGPGAADSALGSALGSGTASS